MTRRRVLVVYAHPVETSFVAAAHDRAVTALERAGHDVDLLDLYAEGFEPRLSAAEWNRAVTADQDEIDAHMDRLRRAQMLVFVYPTWFGGQPAMLKGWIDRIWVEGLAFRLPSGATRPRAALTGVRRIVIVTTHGSSKFINALEGEPGKRLVRRWLRAVCHPRARSRWVAMYNVDRADDAARVAFLDRVERVLASS